MEELLEVITWSQLGIHEKPVSQLLSLDEGKLKRTGYSLALLFLPSYVLMLVGCHLEYQVGLLNVDGYYNPLLALFDKALEEGFLGLSARNIVVSAPTASELLEKMEVCF